MSLKSPKLIAPFFVIGVAVLIVSCGQQSSSPTAPSSISAPGVGLGASEYIVTLADEAPAPPAPGDEDPNAPAPPPPPPPPPGSGPTPWPPGAPPMAAPGVPVPTPPDTHRRMHVKIDPADAPYSGTPVGTFSCRDNPHTWYYDQHVINDSGLGITFSERENFFDGRFVSKNGETIRVEPNRSVILRTRWCSAYPKPHYAQTRFKGKFDDDEAVTFSGPWVRLLTPQ